MNDSIIDFHSAVQTQLIIENHSDEFTETMRACENININENHLKGILCILEHLQCAKCFEQCKFIKFHDAIIELCDFHAHVFNYAMLPCPVKLNIIKECECYSFHYSCNTEDFILNATKENND